MGLARHADSASPLPQSIEHRVIAHHPLVAVLLDAHPAAAAEPVDPATLRRDRFVALPLGRGSLIHQVVRQECQGAGFVPTVVLEVADSRLLVAMVAARYGVAVLPASFAHRHPDGVVVEAAGTLG